MGVTTALPAHVTRRVHCIPGPKRTGCCHECVTAAPTSANPTALQGGPTTGLLLCCALMTVNKPATKVPPGSYTAKETVADPDKTPKAPAALPLHESHPRLASSASVSAGWWVRLGRPRPCGWLPPSPPLLSLAPVLGASAANGGAGSGVGGLRGYTAGPSSDEDDPGQPPARLPRCAPWARRCRPSRCCCCCCCDI